MLHNAAVYEFLLRVNPNKNVTAHLSHAKNTRDMHNLSHSRVGVKGLLAADCLKLQTLMNMSSSMKNDVRPEFRIFRTDSQ